MTSNKKENNSKLTVEQQLAIDVRNKNLLVSASAGSGKTFVMIERIKEMIKNKETGVQEILVVTFTKAAASEMKDRLVRGLEEIEPKNDYLLEQLSLINSASISTLHSFCAKLLKTYFYVIGLDPSFILIDEIEATALKNKALTKLIDSRFQIGDKTFFELLDVFSINRKEDNFREIILKFYHYLLTRTDGDDWFYKTLDYSYDLDINKNECAKFINFYVANEFLKLRNEADELLKVLSANDLPKLVEVVNSMYINLLKIKTENSFNENRKNAEGFEKVKSIPAKVSEGKEIFKEDVKLFKAKYQKIIELSLKQFCFDKSGEDNKRLKITKERVKAIYEYTKIFKEIYDSLKREKVALDFSDLEEYTLKLLENNEIAQEIRNKYKFVFVDEYQDTNLIQEEILRKITRENNLFMVGDVKQSIYKFRASEPEIFVAKYKHYQSNFSSYNMAINLNHNFRSHQDILNFSNLVFNRNMTDDFGQVNYLRDAKLVKGDLLYPIVSKIPAVQISTILVKGQEKNEILGELPVYSVKNHTNDVGQETLKKAELEGKVIVNHIKELLGKEIYKAKTKQTSAIEYKDIAILTASRGAYLELVLKELDKAKIPYSSDIELGVFEDDFVGTIRSFLEILSNFNQDMHLFAVMNSKMFDFNINDLATIRLLSSEKKYFHEAVLSVLEDNELPAKLKAKLNKLFKTIDYFSFLAKFSRVDELIQEVVNSTGVLNRILAEPNGEKSAGLINKLISFLNGKSYNQNLYKFLDYIKDNEIKFGMEGVSNGVVVTTIHKSKGLEYPVVILMGAGQSILKKNRGEFLLSKKFGAGIDYYDSDLRTKQKTIVKNAIILETDRAEKEERLRLLYVALTRAVNHLIVVGTVKENIKECVPENAETFFDWILPILHLGENLNNLKINKITENNLKHNEVECEHEVCSINFSKPRKDFVEKVNDVLNYSYPNKNLVYSPIKTSVSEILKLDEKEHYVPSTFENNKDDAILKGLIYHKILSLIDLKLNTPKTLDQEIQMLLSKGKITTKELKMVNLSDILTLLQNPLMKEISKSKLLREQEFIALTEPKNNNASLIVQGVVDLIAITDDGIIVIDFKTNSSKSEEFYISHYKKQLDIYANVASLSLEKKVIKKLIYSFALKKFIRV